VFEGHLSIVPGLLIKKMQNLPLTKADASKDYDIHDSGLLKRSVLK
jgi:hypothetical protein